MDIREYQPSTEEMIRAAVAGLLKDVRTALPASVTTDSADGHVAAAQPTVKRQVNGADGTITYEDHPEHPDLPIHHLGGGPVVTTHPTVKGDTGAILYLARNIDAWFQSGGTQQPMDDRAHSLADGVFLSGIRAVPDKLAQVSQTSAQTRTVDKRSVIDHGPNGTHIKAVDPSTPAASADFDPFAKAPKFFEHLLHPTNGIAHNATDGGTTHSITNTHADGPALSAANGDHTVTAHPTKGVGLLSKIASLITSPNANLDAQGNLDHIGDHTAGGNISAPKGVVSGMAGQFASGFLGLLKFAGGGFSGPPGSNGALTINAGMVAAPVVQANALYTVAALIAAMPPAPALTGTRAVVSDAMPAAPAASTDPSEAGDPMPTTAATATIGFLSVLQGGGTITCPAFCDGANWVAG